MRDAHDAQVSWFEKSLNIEIVKNYSYWPEFMEICARRNLFTHTTGIISAGYIGLSKKHNFNRDDIIVGKKLGAGPKYYSRALHVVYDFLIKLVHITWRNVDPSSSEKADDELIQHAYDLIMEEKYAQAIDILEFGLSLRKISSERNKRMMAINLANAYKLSGDLKMSTETIEKFDWSAVGVDFRVCICGIRGDIDGVINIMTDHGTINSDCPVDYEKWPVFDGMYTEPKYQEAFKKKFERDLIVPKRVMKSIDLSKMSVIRKEKE